MTDDERIETIRKRAEAATPGPWDAGLRSVCGEAFGEEGLWEWFGASPREHDADFIAHAREDIPWLLAEVERLRGVCDELIETHTRYKMACNGGKCVICGAYICLH